MYSNRKLSMSKSVFRIKYPNQSKPSPSIKPESKSISLSQFPSPSFSIHSYFSEFHLLIFSTSNLCSSRLCELPSWYHLEVMSQRQKQILLPSFEQLIIPPRVGSRESCQLVHLMFPAFISASIPLKYEKGEHTKGLYLHLYLN
jgi:hypothetical protein